MAIPASNVAPIRPTPSKAGRPARQATPNPRRSRSLRESVQAVAHCAPWKAYAMAITLDANFVATEAFSLFASAAVARDTARATATTKVITLVMSAVANSYAMAHTADGLIMQGACIIAGCSVPALIALATYTLGKAARA
jgi:hypothetical protein